MKTNLFFVLFFALVSFLAKAQTPTVNDCLGARPVCNGHYDETDPTAGTNNGMGNYADEIYDSGYDCNSDESSGIWYVFTVQTSGAFQFTITPEDMVNDDYDWILFDATNYSCADYASQSGRDAAKVSANTAGGSANHGQTGINSSNSNTHDDCAGPGTSHGNQWNEDIIVNAGDQYVLYVENWSQLPNGYQIDFTANIVDTYSPLLDQITSSPACGQDQITFRFNERVECGSVTASDFNITGPGGPYTVTNINCNSGATYSQDFTITLNTALTSGGTYTLNMVGQVDDACNNTTSPSSLDFVVTGVTGNINLTQDISCYGGSDGAVVASANGGTTPYSYSWSGGAGSNASATGLSATSYTVTITDAVGVCNDVQTITLTQPSQITSNFSTTNVDCYGASTGSATVNPSNGTPSYTYQWDAAAGGGTTATENNLVAGTYTVTVYDNNMCLHTNTVTITQPTEALTLDSVQLIEPSCNGGNDGQIVIHNIHGGTAGYTVVWNTGDNGTPLQNLTAGNYWGTITDAEGCVISNDASNPFVLGEPTAITNTNTITDATCNGSSTGSIATNASGGTGALSYIWSANTGGQTGVTASNLNAGSYSVTIEDIHNCTLVNTSITINEDPSIVITETDNNDATCGNSDGSATVSASGGTGSGYVYTWGTTPTQNGATISGVPSGAYDVTVTDSHSCPQVLTVNIDNAAAPTITEVNSSHVNVLCNGNTTGVAEVIGAGGTGSLVYAWSSSANTGTTETGLGAGAYTVTVEDENHCSSSITIFITEPTAVNVIISASENPTCYAYSNGSATASSSGGVGSYSYSWSAGGAVSSETNTSLSANITYTVTVEDGNHCQATTNVTLTEPTQVSIDEIDSEKPLCFGDANGTASVITVSGGTSSSGTYSYTWSTTPIQYSSQATALPAGTYYVTVSDDNNCVDSTSITVVQQSLLTANITGIDPLCNAGSDGSASVVGSGGVIATDYTYIWDVNAGGQTTATATGLSVGSYDVTVRDDNSCETTTSISLTEPTAIISNITYQNVSCFGGNNAYAEVLATEGTPLYTYTWSTGSTNDSIGGLSIGTYYVTVYDSNMCPKEDSVLISEPTLLTVTGTSVDVLCNGGSDGQANISVAGGTNPYTYVWSNGDENQNIVDAVGTYMVTVTDNLFCTATETVTINEPDTLSVATVINHPHCGNADGDAMVTPSGGIAPYTYLWTANVGNDTINNFVDTLVSGPYVVTITDGNNCEYIEYLNLSDIGAAMIDVVNIVDNRCFSDSLGSAQASIVSGGTAPFNYSWIAPSGILQTGTSEFIDSLPAGTFSLLVEDANGCNSSLGFSIDENTEITSNMNLVQFISCYGDTNGIVSVTPNGGTLPYSYNWSHDNTLTDSISINLGDGTYYVTITDDSLCTLVNYITINEPSPLTLTLDTSKDVSCFGGNDGEISVMPGGGTPNYNYLWDNGDVSPNTDSLYVGFHTVTLTDNNACFVVDSFDINQASQITAVLTSTNSICGGTTGSLTVTPNGGTMPYSYQWDHDALLTGNVANGLSQGSYNLSIIDSLGCVLDTLGSVVDDGAGTASVLSVSNVLCNGDATGGATINIVGGTSDFTYVISMVGINVDSTLSSNSSYDALNLVYGDYNVNIYDANGCLSTINFSVNQPTELIISDSIVNVDCYDDNTGSIYISTTGGTSGYSYNWNISGSDSLQNNLLAGYYSVTVSDINACEKRIDSIQIVQPEDLLISLDNLTNLSCNNDSTGAVLVSASGGVPSYTYEWSNGETTEKITGLDAGSYIVTITDANLCRDTMSVTLSQPSVLLISDSVYYDNHYGVISVLASGGTPNYSYEWSNGESSNYVSGLSSGDYLLTVTDENGCFLTSAYKIDIEVIIPSVITPNQDGKNDYFRVTNIDAFEQIDIKIFNRWGDVVFNYSGDGLAYEDQSKQWDGTYNGIELPMGSYVYVVDLKNDEEPYTGTVTIVR